ncbi:hypothetical protein EDB92DRAFT_2111135 [Lactarius akahatsu]|uniref:Pentatricopeptide repeat-containing protein n=1 Tax=Lactarius akahatsu TaxID=416441 RepID=A0AAD4LSF5_9AGAM|nr:hypothetical protein EDB92DRAFT_2111135 [Lactarius akahatsu]
MLSVPLCPSRIFATSSSRLYPRKLSRAFTTLNELPPTASPTKPRPPPPPRAPNSTHSTDASKRPQTVQPLSKRRHILQPYELSKRLIELCERGDVYLALNVLQHAPKNAQNVKVWNTLIQKCMKAEKYKLAFHVFVDMKRRGFIPNIRTYATMMRGYAAVEDWQPLAKQLGFVHSIYGQLLQRLKTSNDLAEDRTSGTGVTSLVQYPIALYISILGKAENYQKALDVFHELDTNGPLAPHPKIYSALLSLSADRVGTDDMEATTQAVSDAKYVWRRLVRSLDKQPKQYIESRSVDAIIKVLSRGDKSDHELMFDILRDICGLPRPGEDRPPPPPKVEPNMFILNETLDGCVTAGRPEMTIHYAQIVMDSPELRPILRMWHLAKLLRAHTVLASKGPASPARSENAAAWIEWFMAQGREDGVQSKYSFNTALGLCHLCEDMQSALRIARAVLEGPTRGSSISVQAWTYILRLAIVAPPDDKRRCLDLLARHNTVLDVWEPKSAIDRFEKKDYVTLARCIVQLLQTPLALPGSDAGDGLDVNAETWSDLRRRAKLFLETQPLGLPLSSKVDLL